MIMSKYHAAELDLTQPQLILIVLLGFFFLIVSFPLKIMLHLHF